MMKAPTKSATPANVLRMIPTGLKFSLVASAFSFATAAPVSASVPSGSTAERRSASSAWETPGSALTLMLSNVSGVPSTRWAVAVSKYADVVPPRSLMPSPYPMVPTTVNSRVGPWNSTSMVEPTVTSPFSALVASMATSSGPCGARPVSTSTSPRSSSSAGML